MFSRSVGERVAHTVNETALVAGIDDPPGGSAKALVIVGDDRRHGAESMINERP
ncbi:hypothetical protein LX81_04145 [Palleronia aestuarii]|uniref:Uncharacterized protein n=1 Tax=Palleronia aestuarii TaxID=568105 RepID=A0A2W7MT14_9RHOB|nr:hypothetical protein LX81_04145 [Palleronia aestuarii]